MPKNGAQYVVLLALLVIHLIADWYLCANVTHNQGAAIAGLALVTGQASLFGLWACRSRWKSYVRFPLAAAGVVWTWYVTIQFLPIASDSAMAASYAVFFAVQAAAIAAVYCLSVFLLRGIARRKSPNVAEPPLQFSIGFLLIWTTVFALFLGLGKVLCRQMGWSTEVVRGQYFFFGGVIGSYNAIYALAALAAATARRRLFLRVAGAIVLIALVALTERLVLEFVFGDNGGVHWIEWLIMAAVQTLVLFATLLPLRWCGLLRTDDERAGNPFHTAADGIAETVDSAALN